LLLVTGNFGRKNTGAYPLRGHNNVQGACDFGTMPAWMPGYEAVQDEKVRSKYEKAWGVKLPDKPGINNHQMVEAIHQGKLKAMYLFGEEMGLVDSNSNHVDSAFEKLNFFVVQDIFFTRTAQFADVVLPAAPNLEKDGTFTNTERRIQRFHKALDPVGDSKPDWEIIQLVANRLGANWDYKYPSEIMAEAASLAPIFAGVTYERLEGWKSLLWPVAEDGTDTPLLYTERFAFPDGKARLFPVEWTAPFDAGKEYDLHLNNGRLLEHFHEGNMTYRVDGIREETPERFLEISEELAKERNIESGRWVRVTSRYGSLVIKVLVTSRVHGNQVYLPHLSRDEPMNVLTGSHADVATNTPAFKETAVKIKLLPEQGTNPLRPLNFRYSGKRTPQAGVEVERKWRRKDYRMPGTGNLVQIQPQK
jgi:formate dehydrogenase major subunit